MLEIMTVKQAAELLQMNKATIYRMIGTGLLKATLFGSHYRISKVAVEAYIAGDSLSEKDVVASSEQAETVESERLATRTEAEARQAKAQLEITRANAGAEIIKGERLASDKVKALAEELSELQFKLDKDRVVLDDKGKALEEAYAMKVYQVDAAVEGRIAKGIVEGTKEAAAEYARKLKEALEMYRQGRYWAELYIEIVRLQGGYTDLGGRIRQDMEKRAEALGLIDHTFDIAKTEPKMIEEQAIDKRNRQ